ncbi:DUF3786 domain-containing protein [Breznakiellaceae bacterium SP9]
MKRGYEVTYEWVVKLLSDCNFEDAAERLNLTRLGTNEVTLDFLRRCYIINKQGVTLSNAALNWAGKSEGFDYNLKSVLGYYVLSEAAIDPVNDYCVITAFSGGVFREGNSESIFNNALGRVYGNDYPKFCRVAEALGMVLEERKADVKFTWRYSLLPKIPVKLIYYVGDEEYPTKIQILYDKTAIWFYKFEPLAVLHGCFIEALAMLGTDAT